MMKVVSGQGQIHNLRSLSSILISVAPSRPKHSLSRAVWKQTTPSGTLGPIPATIAKLCSSSSISSSVTVKNSGMGNLSVLAGTVTVTGPPVKSSPYKK